MLFLIYINDLVDSIDTDITINLFADDTKLSLIYNNLNYRDKLQSAINKFYNWLVLWQLENSAKKSFSLTLGKVTSPTYYVNDARISYCSSYIDVGITIDDNLSFKKHIGVCCAKAYNVINRIFRCFITNNVTAILTAYIAYARLHLEFASTVWTPGIEARGYIGLKRQLEKVQKYFTRRLFGRCKIPYLSYDERIKFLDIDYLEIRRIRFDLISTVDNPLDGILNFYCGKPSKWYS